MHIPAGPPLPGETSLHVDEGWAEDDDEGGPPPPGPPPPGPAGEYEDEEWAESAPPPPGPPAADEYEGEWAEEDGPPPPVDGGGQAMPPCDAPSYFAYKAVNIIRTLCI